MWSILILTPSPCIHVKKLRNLEVNSSYVSEVSTMKELNTFQLVKVPEGVEASVKSRTVTVKGARGTLTKAFKHLAVDIYMVDKDTIKVEKWFGKKKQLASVRTVCSHIENLFKGVMKVKNQIGAIPAGYR